MDSFIGNHKNLAKVSKLLVRGFFFPEILKSTGWWYGFSYGFFIVLNLFHQCFCFRLLLILNLTHFFIKDYGTSGSIFDGACSPNKSIG
jgi:hypothetical protein